MPAYASLAAPAMALAVAAFVIFSSFYVPTGLNVRLLKPPANERQFVPAVVIRSVGTGLDRQSVLYLNAKETSWERLGAEVKGELTINSQSVIYVEAEGDVSWQTVASAIDAIKRVSADVVLVSINLPTGLRGHTNF